jgi:hypothetical protein
VILIWSRLNIFVLRLPVEHVLRQRFAIVRRKGKPAIPVLSPFAIVFRHNRFQADEPFWDNLCHNEIPHWDDSNDRGAR